MSRGTLAVTRDQAMLFVDGRYTAYAEKNSPCPVGSLVGDAPIQFLRRQNARSVGFDSAAITYDQFRFLEKSMQGMQLVAKSALLKALRMRKEKREIEAIREAQKLTIRGCEQVISKLKVGVSEEELAFVFEHFIRTHGGSGLSFEPIIAFGENSAYPHHRSGSTKLKAGQIVLIDVGAIVNRYHGDLTRVHFFGKVDSELEKMLLLTQRAQLSAINAVRPGAKIKDLDLAARAIFRQAGVEERFTHGLGHGIGLETHEAPSVRSDGVDAELILEEGMVFTIEPGLYVPGLGGVRWEDIICVTKQGADLC